MKPPLTPLIGYTPTEKRGEGELPLTIALRERRWRTMRVGGTVGPHGSDGKASDVKGTDVVGIRAIDK
jgi:hypothetical protein